MGKSTNAVTCPDCGKHVGTRKIPGGDGTAVYPRKHRINGKFGTVCIGSYHALDIDTGKPL